MSTTSPVHWLSRAPRTYPALEVLGVQTQQRQQQQQQQQPAPGFAEAEAMAMATVLSLRGRLLGVVVKGPDTARPLRPGEKTPWPAYQERLDEALDTELMRSLAGDSHREPNYVYSLDDSSYPRPRGFYAVCSTATPDSAAG